MSKEALKLTDFKYLEAISYTICGSKSVNNAFVVIAYENYLPIYRAVSSIASTCDHEKMPTSIEDQILLLEDLMNRATDEVAKRRFSWFYLAALVMRATEIADENLIYRPQAIAIWQSLVSAGANIKRICETTKIWSDNEKIWFSDLKTEDDGKIYVFSCIAPEWAREYITI